MDPPYKEKNLSPLLKKINTSKVLNNKGIIIIHRHKKENDNLPDEFKIIEQKTYGISKIIFGNFN
jgi:16S rRNA (guanine966-N2)-methyltransferase